MTKDQTRFDKWMLHKEAGGNRYGRMLDDITPLCRRFSKGNDVKFAFYNGVREWVREAFKAGEKSGIDIVFEALNDEVLETKPNTPAESIMEGLQDALGYVKALADYLDSTYLPSEEEERGSAKDAFNAGWNAALGSIYTTEVVSEVINDAVRDKQEKGKRSD